MLNLAHFGLDERLLFSLFKIENACTKFPEIYIYMSILGQ